MGLGQMTERERELISNELFSRFRPRNDEEPSQQKLKEFLRVFTPEGAAKLDFERQQENRELYEHLALGAITPPAQRPQLDRMTSTAVIDVVPEPPAAYQPVTLPHRQPEQPDDLEFDTF